MSILAAESWPTDSNQGGGASPLGIASAICGIIALPSSCCCGCLSVPMGLIGIVLGVVAAVQPQGQQKVFAYVGIASGAGALLITVIAMIFGMGMNLMGAAMEGMNSY